MKRWWQSSSRKTMSSPRTLWERTGEGQPSKQELKSVVPKKLWAKSQVRISSWKFFWWRGNATAINRSTRIEAEWITEAEQERLTMRRYGLSRLALHSWKKMFDCRRFPKGRARIPRWRINQRSLGWTEGSLRFCVGEGDWQRQNKELSSQTIPICTP